MTIESIHAKTHTFKKVGSMNKWLKLKAGGASIEPHHDGGYRIKCDWSKAMAISCDLFRGIPNVMVEPDGTIHTLIASGGMPKYLRIGKCQ